jgi:small subunit ribosomal protein S9
MTDDEHRDETSEESQQETSAQDVDAQPAGPVAEEDSSSSQAAGEEPTSPPADEAAEAEDTPAADAEDSGDESVEKPADEHGEDASEAASQSDSTPPSEEAPDAEQGEDDAPAADAKQSTPADKKEAIPGADLEPIAVETEERPISAEEKARLEAEEEERAKREAELVGETAAEEALPAGRAPAKLEGDARFLATGKRKSAIARVTLLPGEGKIEINRRPLEEFFPRPLHQTIVRQPLAVTGYEGSVDVRVRVHGGGIGGQAGAVRHGIARALTDVDAELRGELKRRGFLTRDARVKERRKAGLKKARKRPQFSKR